MNTINRCPGRLGIRQQIINRLIRQHRRQPTSCLIRGIDNLLLLRHKESSRGHDANTPGPILAHPALHERFNTPGTVAFDGTKIAANASMGANRSEAHLRKLARQYLGRAAATDDAEDELFGEDQRGDELPEDLTDHTRRGERISQALAEIERRRAAEQAGTEAERAAAAEYVAKAGDPAGRAPTGQAPKAADPVAVARARWQREHDRAQARFDAYQVKAAAAAARGHRLPGTPAAAPDDHPTVMRLRAAYDQARTAAEHPDTSSGPDTTTSAHRANLTDPDSRLLKTRNGWMQGYNCQTATSADGFIISARATQDANDVHQFVPTMNDVTATAGMLAEHTGRDDLAVGTMIGDAGYDSHANLTAPGPDRLIANATRRDLNQAAATDPATGPPPPDATTREQMDHRLRTDDGHALYARRAPMVEAPNGWLKDRRGLRRGFARRGIDAVQAELSLAAAVTNLLKIATNGITTAQLATA
ncbi:Transposase DDE domain-containing protein [Jiangella alkaliphila]|uniref:Transposase DDE domain-containing protein n=1 Tax=Jiangella alkaliphila TaxID=419479 RepID=A0A1H2L392_9ACTN|nr:Transposase DDE domain-containing protein [Jiangella alkaliphila]